MTVNASAGARMTTAVNNRSAVNVNDVNVNGRHSIASSLDGLTYVLTALLIMVPFAISFASLSGLASEMGVSWAFLYPLMVDGGLLIFKFLVLTASLRGETDEYSWGMAGLLTFISVGLNVAHVPADVPSWWLAAFMYALPPLLILAAFVAVARRIEQRSKMQKMAVSLAEMKRAAREARQELQAIEAEATTAVEAKQKAIEDGQRVKAGIEAYRLQVEKEKAGLAKEVAELAAKEEAAKARRARLEAAPSPKASPVKVDAPTAVGNEAQPEDIMLIMSAEPNVSQAEIARRLDMSKGWVSKQVKELKENRLVLQNGHGWEVLA